MTVNCMSKVKVPVNAKPPGPSAAVMKAAPRVGPGVGVSGLPVPSHACDPVPSCRSTARVSVVTLAS